MTARKHYHVTVSDPATRLPIAEATFDDWNTMIGWCIDQMQHGNVSMREIEAPPTIRSPWLQVAISAAWLFILLVGITLLAYRPEGGWWAFICGVAISLGLRGYITAIIREREDRARRLNRLNITHVSSPNRME